MQGLDLESYQFIPESRISSQVQDRLSSESRISSSPTIDQVLGDVPPEDTQHRRVPHELKQQPSTSDQTVSTSISTPREYTYSEEDTWQEGSAPAGPSGQDFLREKSHGHDSERSEVKSLSELTEGIPSDLAGGAGETAADRVRRSSKEKVVITQQ